MIAQRELLEIGARRLPVRGAKRALRPEATLDDAGERHEGRRGGSGQLGQLADGARGLRRLDEAGPKPVKLIDAMFEQQMHRLRIAPGAGQRVRLRQPVARGGDIGAPWFGRSVGRA